MTATKRALIVGGVAGGASCAARLRRLDEQVEIVPWTEGRTFLCELRFAYYVGDVIQEEAKLLVATPELFRKRCVIETRSRTSISRAPRSIDKTSFWVRTSMLKYKSYQILGSHRSQQD